LKTTGISSSQDELYQKYNLNEGLSRFTVQMAIMHIAIESFVPVSRFYNKLLEIDFGKNKISRTG
jgi:hypothetical protein